jgi:ubiquinone/menaquinone biosynthesis C-methylase UbiE
VRLLNAAADRLPIPDASADLVVCHMAFMLFTPLAQTVREIGRILKPGGKFAAVVPTLRKPAELFRAWPASCAPRSSRNTPRWARSAATRFP